MRRPRCVLADGRPLDGGQTVDGGWTYFKPWANNPDFPSPSSSSETDAEPLADDAVATSGT